MAASTEQKLDYLLKKIGYTASKTGLAEDSSLSGTKKAPFAEAIPSPLVTPSTTIWNESASIPTTPPGSDTAQVRVYLAGTSGHRMTVDSTVSGSRAFIAYSTYNNTSTAILGDWIDPQFGDSYIIKVYKGDPNSGGVLLSAAGAGSNDTWFFDYSSGVLNFNGTVIPSGVTDTNIYIVGYRYIGVKGLSTAGITTSGTSTFKDLNVTGVSTFAGNINANGNIVGDNSTNITGIAGVTATTLTGTLQTAAQTNITSVGTLGALTVSGNINANGNIVGDNSTNITGIAGVTATTLSGTLQTAAQTNITSVGTLGALTVSGNINANGNIIGDNSTNISGINSVTATTYFGDGTKLIGVSTAGISTEGTTTLNNLEVAGISTFAGLVDINGNLQTSGNVTLGNGSGDTIDPLGRFVRELVPSSNGDKDLGTSSFRWGTLHVKNILQNGGGISTFTNDINVTGVSTFVGIATFQSVDINQGTIDGTNIGFNHRANGQFVNLDATGTLGVDGTSTLNNLNVTGVSTFVGDITGAGDLTLTSTDTGSSAAPIINLFRNSASPADADYLGQIKFQGESDTGVQRNYAKITGKILDASNGTEDGILEFAFLKAGSNNISGRFRSDSLQLLNGTNFSVAGDSTFTGDINANGNIVGDNSTNITGIAGVTASTLTGTLQTAAQTNITSVGTLASLNVTGDVSIGGTLTYEDVTNIDSVGLITARSGVFLPDDQELKLGNTAASPDTKIYKDSSNNQTLIESANPGVIVAKADYFRVRDTSNNNMIQATVSAAVSLHYNSALRLATSNSGVDVTGAITASGNINANGNIIGDSSTNITGINEITAAGNITANGNIIGDNATNISGINSVTASSFYGDGSNLSNVGFTTSVGTFNASSGVATIDSFAHATEDYKVAEYTLHFTNGSNIQAQKLLVMQDGTTAYSQEFAVMSSGSQLVSVDSAISGANVLVRATPESGISGTTTFRWRRIVQE